MRLALCLAMGLQAFPPPALAQGPVLDIALTGGAESRVELRLVDLLKNGDFVAAMESGFPLYVEFRIQLRQSKSLWDREVESETWEYVVLYDPVRERYQLEDANGSEIIPSRELLERRISQAYGFVFVPDGEGAFYYAATVDVRTLDDADVDEVFAWLKGEDVELQRPRRPGAVTRAARRLLVAVAPLPSLRLTARTTTFDHR